MTRPEQEWTLLLAVCAVLPHAIALANLWGWIGDKEAVQNQLGWLYFVSLLLTLGLAIWAMVRSRRTLRVFREASPRERTLAVMAHVLSVPTLIVSAFLFLWTWAVRDERRRWLIERPDMPLVTRGQVARASMGA